MEFLSNEYVITHISRYLPVPDLKIVRTLNSIWNSGSKPVLKRKGSNRLNLKEGLVPILKATSFHKTHFPCETITISNHISFTHSQDILLLPDIYREFSKQFSKNDNLLPPVKFLRISLKIWEKRENQLLNDILEYYSPSIQIIYLSLYIKYVKPKLRPSINFPELMYFYNVMGYSYGDEFYKKIYAAAPNIIHIKSENSSSTCGFECLVKNPQLLPKLSGLILYNVSVVNLQYLARWPRKLELLAIHFVVNTSNKVDLYRALQMLLKNQSESLTSLHLFELPCPVTKLESELKLKLPPFPNMETLSLKFESHGVEFEFEENGNINYERDFPKLKKLKICSNYESWALFPVYDSFFHKDENQICKSMSSLSLPKSRKGIVNNLEERLGKLFPNARI